MTKVIDCFPFFDEFLILDVRFRELYDVVDRFVIVEGEETFTGVPKPLYLSESLWQRYPQYADKVDIIVAPREEFSSAWDRERFQKNLLCKSNLAYLNLNDDDLILFSDADEIPRRSVIENFVKNGFPREGGAFGYKTYYYKFNLLTSEICFRSKYSSYASFTEMESQRQVEQPLLTDAGWHFSFIKSEQKIKEKIEAFSHQEFNVDFVKNSIAENVEKGLDLFYRPEMKMIPVDIDESFPEYIKENVKDLSEWIHRGTDSKEQRLKKAFDFTESDKSSAHNYEKAYAELLPEKITHMLEIGIYNGSSALAWEILYPNAKIYCVDIVEEYLINRKNITSYLVDQSSLRSLRNLKHWCSGIKFDIIIDDGSHVFEHSKTSFLNLFSMLTSDGTYIIEDISKNGNGWQQTIFDWTNLLLSMDNVTYKFIDTKPDANDDSVVLAIRKND